MTENFSNNYETGLSADISDTDTSLTVSSATGAPSPNFRILIDEELMLVTGVSGTTFTVTRGIEGTTPAAHVATTSADSTNYVRFPTSGTASYTASSQFSSLYSPDKAADGLFANDGNTWATSGCGVNPWWQVTWTVAQNVGMVRFWSRGDQFATGGTVSLSDGTSYPFTGPIPTSPSPGLEVLLDGNHSITTLRITSTGGCSGNGGLAEVETEKVATATSVAHVLTAGGIIQAILDRVP